MKAKVRRYLSMMLALLLAASILAGCSQTVGSKPDTNGSQSIQTPQSTQSEPAKKITLKVWEADGPEKTFIEEAGMEYKKENPNVEVIFEPVSFIDASKKIDLDGPAGLGPDIFCAPHDQLGNLLDAGHILENPYADNFRSEFLDASITAVSKGGKLYGYPVVIETYALFYNKKLVEKAPETWDDIIAFARTFNKPAENKYALVWEPSNNYFGYIFLSGFGVDLFGPGGDDKAKHGLNSAEAVEGLTYFQNLRKQILDARAEDLNTAFCDAAFQNGNAAYYITGPWNFQNFKDVGIDFGIGLIPKFPGKDKTPITFSGVRSLFVSAYSPNTEEAQKFTRFLTSKPMMEKRFKLTNAIPPRKDIKLTDPYSEGIMAQAAFAKPLPSISAINTYWASGIPAFTNIWNGAEIKNELDTLASTIEAAQ